MSLPSFSFGRVPPLHMCLHANRQQETQSLCFLPNVRQAWGWSQGSSACEYGEKNPFLPQGFNVTLMVSDMITENTRHLESRWLMCKPLTAETHVVNLPSWLSSWDLGRKRTLFISDVGAWITLTREITGLLTCPIIPKCKQRGIFLKGRLRTFEIPFNQFSS